MEDGMENGVTWSNRLLPPDARLKAIGLFPVPRLVAGEAVSGYFDRRA